MSYIDLEIPEPWPDYKDLISKDDWDKYFEGNQYVYSDVLTFALIRALEAKTGHEKR